jgi:hypothetical protein
LDTNYSCNEKCPDGYWADSNTKKCVLCTAPCSFCSSELSCKKCVPTHFLVPDLLENNCKEKCPDGYWPNLIDRVCYKCKSECLTCDTLAKCRSCASGFYLNPETFECKDFCPGGYLKNEETNYCDKCHPNCKTCFGTKDNCTSCKDSYLLDSKCVDECPKGKYKDNVWFTCGLCHPSCLTCIGNRNKDCLTCDESKDPDIKLINGYCANGCPGNLIREKDGINCIDLQKCFKSILLSYPKLFSLTGKDFAAELIYVLDESCSQYGKDLEYVWDEDELAEAKGKSFKIASNNLKEGKLNFGLSLKYNGILFIKLKGESNLVLYKVKIFINN